MCIPASSEYFVFICFLYFTATSYLYCLLSVLFVSPPYFSSFAVSCVFLCSLSFPVFMRSLNKPNHCLVEAWTLFWTLSSSETSQTHNNVWSHVSAQRYTLIIWKVVPNHFIGVYLFCHFLFLSPLILSISLHGISPGVLATCSCQSVDISVHKYKLTCWSQSLVKHSLNVAYSANVAWITDK